MQHVTPTHQRPTSARTLLSAALLLGLGISLSAQAEVHAEKKPDQPVIEYANVWADDQGASHVSHCTIEGLDFKSYAPPAAPQWIGVSPDEVESIAYAVLPPGYVGTWHHAPGPQWVITLKGQWSVETTDGSVLTQGPGQMQFNADANAKPRPGDERIGHISRTVGDEPNVQLIIKLKANAKRTTGACAY
ncbi:hypothetical protein [Pseudomonas sp. 5P_3.1_Bac2]|uniref:hypothetical protein n=1 Tax=Pseudomonas sp. 5P_3.1_Bac2 TaxID=2971617 RepID=UPI0029055D30|nr:hypothetical protein [Pseudomonas sp. 5P_3.1_Bac2]